LKIGKTAKFEKMQHLRKIEIWQKCKIEEIQTFLKTAKSRKGKLPIL